MSVKLAKLSKCTAIEAGSRMLRNESLFNVTLGQVRDAHKLSQRLSSSIFDWLLSGKCWSTILENQISFTKVKFSPDFKRLDIHWTPTGLQHRDRYIGRDLNDVGLPELSRHLQNSMGLSTKIVFSPDHEMTRRKKLFAKNEDGADPTRERQLTRESDGNVLVFENVSSSFQLEENVLAVEKIEELNHEDLASLLRDNSSWQKTFHGSFRRSYLEEFDEQILPASRSEDKMSIEPMNVKQLLEDLDGKSTP